MSRTHGTSFALRSPRSNAIRSVGLAGSTASIAHTRPGVTPRISGSSENQSRRRPAPTWNAGPTSAVKPAVKTKAVRRVIVRSIGVAAVWGA